AAAGPAARWWWSSASSPAVAGNRPAGPGAPWPSRPPRTRRRSSPRPRCGRATSGGLRQVCAPRRRDGRAGDVDEHLGPRRARLGARVHADLPWQVVALAAVARRARRDDVLPARRPSLGARDDVVDGQIGPRAAVLARPPV